VARPVGSGDHDGPEHRQAQEYRYRCGERLATARQTSGLTVRQLAAVCGFSDASIISRYEAGVMPSLVRQFRLAYALGVHPEELWSFTDRPAGRITVTINGQTDHEIAMACARLAHYVSTYCIHGDHDACRRTCKTCDDPCRCECHG
jgi:transcriptional regulator with XRE-family HTH domain